VVTHDCAVDHLVISEVRTRGAAGASDEFIELYNPTDTAVSLDQTWKLEARSWTAGSYGQRWVGDDVVLWPHQHLLVASGGFQAFAPDYDMGPFGIADGGSIRLMHAGVVVDALCYYFDGPSLDALQEPGYSCEGTPISNLPHDNSSAGQSNSDVALERKPGGELGACRDTDDSLGDFQAVKPAHPETLLDPATP
jgi:hypothetical protein